MEPAPGAIMITRPRSTSWRTTPPDSPAPRSRTNSKVSFSSNNTSYFTRQDYMDSLVPPSVDEFEKISHVQEERELELKRRSRELKRQSLEAKQQRDEDAAHRQPTSHERRRGSMDALQRAATVIQRTYRGYRVRREMKGMGLDATTRWVTAIREAQFRELTTPRPRSAISPSVDGEGGSLLERDESGLTSRPSTARGNWRKAAVIARRAGHDDLLESQSSSSSSASSLSSSDVERMSPAERAAAKRRHVEATARRKESSKMMGLQYFLEMVDLKHRYGSNLRVYHEVWKMSDTKENFFYWLDYGEGKNIEVDACPRDRLEREQVRYLSREERQYYLVSVDKQGRLCWAKNGMRIDTTEQYKDSVHGVVPADDPTPAWSQTNIPLPTPSGNSSDAASIESALEADRAAKYANPDFDEAQGVKKVSHLSAATIFNKLLRKSVKKNTWIFVADTSFRLFVGIKNSGAFQHSSFLQGSRISAAGLIKIKNGRLSSLSPLSGHYRPPASNFRAFVKSLKEAGVDTTHVSISKSYAVLVGLEMYVKTRKKGKEALKRMTHKKDQIVAPEATRKKDEELMDNSKSAEKERQVLAREEEEREENRAGVKLLRKLNISPREPEGQKGPEDHAEPSTDGI